ncbi:response regulator [Siculibacillus lacustris]|uniref:histidine kinase n=1 Tax=Siculibacillus lacustris TaxID=1549641 RepID=A0A4Q9VSY1_9HYPH|nr:ATP-binding protein [Siculibacillus lacustris]TBW38776.1 response regulator [Siculibacillus lacustris]
MERLHDIVAGGEKWLTARIIHYAKQRGFTPFTSTLEQAWLASIRGLSEPLLAALAEGRTIAAVSAEPDYARDPIARYGIEAARRHRTRGITLGLFLGLMKSYRRSYLDLVAATDLAPEERAAAADLVENFFDRVEVGFCDEWAGRPADEQFDQLRAQNRAMTNEKNKYLTIFESLNDPVVLIDETGAVENLNHAAFALFGAGDAPGARYYGDARVPMAEILGLDLVGGADLACERRLPTNLGPRWFDIKTQRMLDVSEKYLGTVVILVDITEYRRATEDAERADRAKSAFLATMSHEIRTPIHGILGLAELLRERPLDDQDHDKVEAIARSGEMLSSVVSDILDYSKIEAGVLDLEHIEFSVAAVIDDVFGLMQPLARRKPDLRLILETPRLPTVVGDPGKLRQILLNLIGNAVKFTESGTVWLAIEDVSGPGDAWMLRFVVADTGMGIAESKLASIFEPFTQSDGSVARRFGGSGLGLAICRSLVQRFGGEIGVDSRLGEGSRFWFTVPFERGLGLEPARRAGSDADAPPLPASLDVLVVEDNEVNSMVAGGLLERAGHRATIAATGADALACIESGRHHLVLMDLRLPDMDGLEVTRRIRALADPAKAAIPIVALSAQVLKADIEACIAAGMNDFLGKPFHLDRLEATLRRVIAAAPPPAPPVDPEPAAGIEPATIDETVLAGHVAVLGAAPTGRIVAAFAATTADLPADLERCAATGDRAAIAEIAHRLKSASAHVGLAALAARAAAVETTARGTRDGAITGPANDLASACRDARALLDRTWRRLGEAQPAKT